MRFTMQLLRHMTALALIIVGLAPFGTRVNAQNGMLEPLALTASTGLQSSAVGPGDTFARPAIGSILTADYTSGPFGSPEGRGLTSAWSAVAPHLLDDMRGGFDTSMQLRLSFGIERAVYLNGALVTTTSFNLPAMRGMAHEDGSEAALPTGSIALIQNGPGNAFSAGPAGAPLAATVIQNTLNNQTIQSLTTINATANSLGLLKANVFQGLIRDGIGQTVVLH